MKSEKAMEEARQQLARLNQSFGRVVFLVLPRGKKRLEDKGWDKITFEETQTPAYQKELVAALTRGGNVAVRLGPLSDGLRAIDIDRKDRLEEFRRLNPQLRDTVRVYGLKGCQFFFRLRPDTPFPTGDNGAVLPLKCDNGENFGEWRFGESNGAYSLVFGQHPDDRKVVWRIEGDCVRELLFADIRWPHDVSLPWEKEKAAQGGALGFIPPDLEKRIAAYLAKCPPSIAGLRGDDALFKAACKVGNGFALTEDQTYEVLRRWFNPHCRPPWDEARLRYKASEAMSVPHDQERGHLWGDGAGPWSAPRPLHAEMRPVASLPAEMLPEPLRPWLTDVAHRMQCPLDFVATAAICMVSGVIGAGCTIRPKERDNWTIVPNLWGGVIARSGMKKTPAIDEAFKPLRRLEQLAKEKHDASKNEHAAEHVVFEARRKALKAEMDKAAREGGDMDRLKAEYASLRSPESQPRRRFMTTDTTIEKAGELMNENPRGLTILRDELVGLLVTWDREDRKDDRCFHLQGWNGYGGYTSDRIGRGTIDTPQLCEVIFGGIQPSKFLVYLKLARNNIENDGLLQRFQLLVDPDELTGKPEIVDEYPDQEAKERVFTIVKKLSEMDFIACGGQIDEPTKIPYFHFAPAAQVFFNNWLLALETKLRSQDDDPIVNEHLSKYPKLMPSLALIFHLVEVANGGMTPQDPLFADRPNKVPLRCTKLAAEWCDYLETHARRIYGLIANVTVQGAKRILRKIEDGSLKSGFNAWEVYHQGWSFLDTKELTQAALDELVETGWLREISPPKPSQKGGRPIAVTYQIHPQACEILKKGKEAK